MEFRNIDVDPDAPVEQLGFEAVLAMVERGGILEWRRIVGAIRADPYGKVASELEAAVEVAQEYAPSTSKILADALQRARDDFEQRNGSNPHQERVGDSRQGHDPQ